MQKAVEKVEQMEQKEAVLRVGMLGSSSVSMMAVLRENLLAEEKAVLLVNEMVA